VHATESSLMQACCPCLWPGGHSDRWYGMVHMDHGLPDRKSRPRLKDKRWLLLGSNRRFIPIMHDRCYNFRTAHGPPSAWAWQRTLCKRRVLARAVAGDTFRQVVESSRDAKRARNIGRIFTHMGFLILFGRSTSVVQDTESTSESHTFQYTSTSTTHAFT